MDNKDVHIYFKSKSAALLFIALHTDGAVRHKLLGVTDKCYHDRDAAELWRIETINAIMKDGGMFGVKTAEAAIAEIQEMYDIMTYEDPDNEEGVVSVQT